MPQVNPSIETFARIIVVGVGGAGGAAINRMIEAGVDGVQFVAVNTDAQALHHSLAPTKIHIGKDTTRGLGAGADPSMGRDAAEESSQEIANTLEGADMIFITLGAGGGTGSGAGPVVAKLAKDSGALVVGFATKPFAFEGVKRRQNAEIAIDSLRDCVDTLITIPNDRLLQTIDRHTPLLEAFKVADDVLRQGVQGISDLITVNGLINLDFADVKTVMSAAGSALMGIGRASGDNRAQEAAQQAIESPLLEVSIDGARGILFNVIGGMDMTMHEINAAAETITAAADPDANIIFGATITPELEGEIIITVVATGFDAAYFSNRGATQGLPNSDSIGLATPASVSHVPSQAPHLAVPGKSSHASGTPAQADSSMPLSRGPAAVPSQGAKADDDMPVKNINMDLDKEAREASEAAENLLSNKDTGPSIWSMRDDDEDKKPEVHPPGTIMGQGIGANDDSDIEKPSFLRRLKRHKDDDKRL